MRSAAIHCICTAYTLQLLCTLLYTAILSITPLSGNGSLISKWVRVRRLHFTFHFLRGRFSPLAHFVRRNVRSNDRTHHFSRLRRAKRANRITPDIVFNRISPVSPPYLYCWVSCKRCRYEIKTGFSGKVTFLNHSYVFYFFSPPLMNVCSIYTDVYTFEPLNRTA